jgi:hypothetical protein
VSKIKTPSLPSILCPISCQCSQVKLTRNQRVRKLHVVHKNLPRNTGKITELKSPTVNGLKSLGDMKLIVHDEGPWLSDRHLFMVEYIK